MIQRVHTIPGYMMWIDLKHDSAVINAGGSWRLSLSDFDATPKHDTDLRIELDNHWKPTWTKVYEKEAWHERNRKNHAIGQTD